MGMTAAEKNRNGIREWVFQRATNFLVILYGVVMLCFFLSADGFSYDTLSLLFSKTWFVLYTLITLACACLNSVLAGWQIATDYGRKFNISESALTSVGVIVSAGYFVFGLMILF